MRRRVTCAKCERSGRLRPVPLARTLDGHRDDVQAVVLLVAD